MPPLSPSLALQADLDRLARALVWERFEAIVAGLQAVIDCLPVGDRTATLADEMRWALGELRDLLSALPWEEA